MSDYAKSASGTLNNPTLTGDIDAIGIKGRSSSAAANVRCQDSSSGSHGYLAISAQSSMRYKHDIADISDDRLNPERLYDLQQTCGKTTPLGVGWIAHLFYSLMCMLLLILYTYYDIVDVWKINIDIQTQQYL